MTKSCSQEQKQADWRSALGDYAGQAKDWLGKQDPTMQSAIGGGALGLGLGGLIGGINGIEQHPDEDDENAPGVWSRGIGGALEGMLGGGAIGLGLGAGASELPRWALGEVAPGIAERAVRQEMPSWSPEMVNNWVGQGANKGTELAWHMLPRQQQFQVTDQVSGGKMPHTLMQNALQGVQDWSKSSAVKGRKKVPRLANRVPKDTNKGQGMGYTPGKPTTTAVSVGPIKQATVDDAMLGRLYPALGIGHKKPALSDTFQDLIAEEPEEDPLDKRQKATFNQVQRVLDQLIALQGRR